MELDKNQILKEKYKEYGIPDEVLDQIFSLTEDEMEKTIKIENYIISQIQKEDIEKELLVLEKCSSLKTIIKYNKLYLKLINELASKEKIDTTKEINKLYEDALERAINSYNINRLISENILYNMKRILLEEFNYSTSEIEKEFYKNTEEDDKKQEIRIIKKEKEEVKPQSKKSKKQENKTIKEENILVQKDINVDFDTTMFTFGEIPVARKMINLDYLLNLVGYKTGTKDDAIIFLLFGGIKGKYYKNSEIAKALNIDEEYVNNIYIKCLDAYKNSLEEIYKIDVDDKKLGLKTK